MENQSRLADKNKMLNLLAAASENLGTSLDFQSTARHSCKIFVPHLSAWSSLFIFNEDSPELKFVASHHKNHEVSTQLELFLSDQARFWAHKQEVQYSIREGRVVTVANSHSWFGERYLAHLPVIQKSEIIGLITLGSVDEFTLEDLHIAEEISKRAAAAIDNARSYLKLTSYEAKLINDKELAEKASQEKSNFLANMSHEIRSPISAILGFADLLMLPQQSEQDRLEWSQRIKHNGQHLLRLINDILNLAKVESGQFTVQNNCIDFLEFISDLEVTNRTLARDKKLDLQFNLETEIPERFGSDSTRLRQILNNLIGNAIKFTEAGHVKVQCGYIKNLGYLYFDVEDTGPGMTEKESSLLFQPFVQANTAHSKQFGGTGLGLALSLKLSQLLGGTVELVHTAPGNGSKFRAMVKPSVLSGVKYISQLKSKVSTTAEEKTFKEHELKNKKILVVDDSPDNQYLMRKILGLRGADVTLAGSGDSALDLDNISDFDVVLMDIQMPGKDGNQTTAELRKRGFTKPIIAFTANALPKDKELSLRSGCNRHVTKPVDQKELLRVLSELLTT
ncbi:MAG: hypothetical protein K0R29_1020 [Pseudobdellovibrio sp.]|jgi:signal transduction histidine kinase|nr:hypothetical protein [Pseudobdellovibrio sp.]